MIRHDPETRSLRLSVTDLVRVGAEASIRRELAARSRLALGSREHARRREELHEPGVEGLVLDEVPVRATLEIEEHEVVVEGRLDGFRVVDGQGFLEEVKSVILPSEIFDDFCLAAEFRQRVQDGELHPDYRLQLEIYHYLVSEALPAPLLEILPESGGEDVELRARLIFRNLAADPDRARELEVEIEPDSRRTREEIESRVRQILEPLRAREARRQFLTGLADDLPFPFPGFRPGQREIRDTVSEAIEAGAQLLLQAPPGLGKTAAVLHAALSEALPRGRQVFWITARTTQQALVGETARLVHERLRESGKIPAGLEEPPLRVRFLHSRESQCANLADGHELFCHEHHCEYARDYSRKLRESDLEANFRELAVLDPRKIFEDARAHGVCPYEVQLGEIEGADLVIGDYNYILDAASPLRRGGWLEQRAAESILVIDEAHNLPSRSREAHSPTLDLALLRDVSRLFPLPNPGAEASDLELGHRLAESLEGVTEATESESGATSREVDLDLEPLERVLEALQPIRQRRVIERRQAEESVRDDPVETLSRELEAFLAAVALRESGVPVVTLALEERGREFLRALCLSASKPLAERLGSFGSTVAVSATLTPFEFFGDLLGLDPARLRTLESDAGFPPAHRGVFVVPDIETTYRRRSEEAPRVAETIDRVAAACPGNYLAFFSSHRFLQEVAREFDSWRVGTDLRIQDARMSRQKRDQLLEELRQPDSRKIVLAVQGGIFGEGVDYPGNMLRGVIVVGPGLPRFGPEEELLRAHHQERYGQGFEYTYLYPGMHRVIQSAGRLLRSPEDVGVVVLIGKRFANRPYRDLLPRDWYRESPGELVTDDLEASLREFWARQGAGLSSLPLPNNGDGGDSRREETPDPADAG